MQVNGVVALFLAEILDFGEGIFPHNPPKYRAK
jgi:hypothetical protein